MTRAVNHQLRLVFEDQTVADAVAFNITKEFNRSGWTIRLGGTVALFTLSFLIATITLRPLKKAFRSQQNFIASASHELRTPLAVMRTTSEVALMNSELGEQEMIKTIRGNLNEIKRITDTLYVLLNFANYSRAEPLRFMPVNLYDAVSRAVELIRPIADAQKVQLVFSGRNYPTVKGNAVALEELAINLLKNAVAYTPKGGVVEVTIHEEGANRILFTVKDTGIGIPENDLPYIFDPFFRGNNSVTARRENPGTGLGLAIVREIANLHQAKLEVKSELGLGTAFFVRFASEDRRVRSRMRLPQRFS